MRVHTPKAARREDENGAGKPRDLAVLDHGFMAHAQWGRPLLLDRVPRLDLPEAPSGEPPLSLVLDKAQVGSGLSNRVSCTSTSTSTPAPAV